MIGIIDYGMGNLRSVKNSLNKLGEEVIISSNLSELDKADGYVLPGVGAFGEGMKKLSEAGLDLYVKDITKSSKPLLGICLGMQLLFDESTENGSHKGLGIIDGKVSRLVGDIKVPHMGWNCLMPKNESLLLAGINERDFVYYVHSYYVETEERWCIGTTQYGGEFPVAVQRDQVYGLQFHPEKSGDIGLRIMRNFIELANVEV